MSAGILLLPKSAHHATASPGIQLTITYDLHMLSAHDNDYDSLCEQHADWLSGWSLTHDYDPTWDYTVAFEHCNHPLYLFACEVLATVCRDARAAGNSVVPFSSGRVFPAHLDGAAAIYVSGTSAEPVILIDIAAHETVDGRDQRRAVADSVLHELRHAVQDGNGWDPCEDEAENGSERIPF